MVHIHWRPRQCNRCLTAPSARAESILAGLTAFAGPFAVSWETTVFDSQRAGMSVIVVLLVIGFVLMLRVPERLHLRDPVDGAGV